MASKGGIITGRVFIWLTVVMVVIIMGCICYAGSCNIRANSFNDVKQREGIINMYGCVFWGYPLAALAAISGAALVGLLVIADNHVKKIDITAIKSPGV